MDRITRKSLKDDKFAAEVTHSVEYLTHHRQQVLRYGGVGVVVLAALVGFFFYRQHRRTSAHRALYKALETYHALVTTEERPGRVTFKTDDEKWSKALREFEAITKDFSGTTETRIARYYLGLVYRDQGKMAEAQKQLEQAVSEGAGTENVAALARLALADVYLAQGKDEEGRKIYEYLIKNPSDTVSEARAQLAMARYLRDRKPDEARKLLNELMKRPGTVSAAAGMILRDMPSQ
jgi:tetratricopeptide (TPR) repeat protein